MNGVTRTVSELSRGLCLKGHHVVILTRWRNKEPRQETGYCPSVRRVGIGRRSGESAFFVLLLATKALATVHGERIDIVHAHGTIAGISAVLVKVLTGRRFIVTFHQDALLGWETGHYRIGGFRSHLARIAQKLVSSQAELITVQSDAVGRILKRVLSIRNDRKVVVLPNPIDVLRFAETGTQETRSTTQVLYVGNLLKRKRVDGLLHAFRLVHDSIPAARLTIIGNGPQWDRLHSLVSELEISDSVTFSGQVSDRELISAYQKAAVFVLPSEAEVFGIVLAEALLLETPVVSTRTVGASSVITSDLSGILVDIDDTDALAGAIMTVLTDVSKAHAMATNGKVFVKANFGLDVVTMQLEHIYARAR